MESQRFTHGTRNSYFSGIPDGSLGRAVILLDPDTGLPPNRKESGGDAYVGYDETQSIYERMGEKSVLVVYQHHRREKREVFYHSLWRKLHGEINPETCACVSDNVVAFVTLTKTKETGQRVQEILDTYAELYREVMPNACTRPDGFGP